MEPVSALLILVQSRQSQNQKKAVPQTQNYRAEMSDIEYENNPWIDLASFLWARVPVVTLVTVIETHGLKALDSFDRCVDASAGDDKDVPTVRSALSYLAQYYEVLNDPRSDGYADYLIEYPDTPLVRYGWPENDVPFIQGLSFVGHRLFFDGKAKQCHSELSGTAEQGRDVAHGQGVLAEQIIRHFHFWEPSRWDAVLSKPPKWLESGRIGAVVRRKAAHWNPAVVANCLWTYREERKESSNKVHRKYARDIPPKTQLEKIIQEHFPAWQGDWQANSH